MSDSTSVAQFMCPECIQGKCVNCDGVAGIGDDDFPVACHCKANAHPLRKHYIVVGYDENGEIQKELEPREDLSIKTEGGGQWAIAQSIDTKTRQILSEEWVPLPAFPSGTGFKLPGTPDADPGEVALFIEDGNITGDGIRLRPDAQIVKDFLMDVQVLNTKGEWVPAVPLPIFLWFGRCQCHCGVKRKNRVSYMEHFAYAHILGMAD
jgi:hypothetical protein